MQVPDSATSPRRSLSQLFAVGAFCWACALFYGGGDDCCSLLFAQEISTGSDKNQEIVSRNDRSVQILRRVFSSDAASASGERTFFFTEDVSVSAETPFLLFGLTLKFLDADANNARVFARAVTATNGNEEAKWIPLVFDAHANDDENLSEQERLELRSITGAPATLRTYPATLPASTKRVEIKILLRPTLGYPKPVPTDYQCFIYSPGHSKASETAVARNASPPKSVAATANTVAQRPAFVTRTDWGCPWGQTSGPNTLVSTVPTHLIVHHSFSPGNNVTDWAAAVRSIWNYHVLSNGWSDIGYNWLIDPNGVIYQGRAWVDSNDNTQGAHFCGYNRQTTGICMLGNYNEREPSAEAQQSLTRLLAYLARVHNISPRDISFHQSSSRQLHGVSGHRDGCATDCPGHLLYPLLPVLRNRTHALANPPIIEKLEARATDAKTATLSAFVRPNGSATDVYVEWDVAAALSPAGLRNRRLAAQIGERDSAQIITATLGNLESSLTYSYRFVAQNSETRTESEEQNFTLAATSAPLSSLERVTLRLAPNPTPGVVSVAYVLERPAFARLVLTDIRGGVIAILHNAAQSSGVHRLELETQHLPVGAYFCALELHAPSGSHRIVQTLSVVR
jgi:hypothetical protein